MKAGRQIRKMETEAAVMGGMRDEVTGVYSAIEGAIDTAA